MGTHRRRGWALAGIALVLSLLLGVSVAQAGMKRQPGQTVNNPYSAPELDPGAAGAAAILLGGGALLIFDRRRRKRA